MAVPPPEAVVAGAPVDNTVGIAVLTQTVASQSFWQAILDGGLTAKQILALIAAASAGKLSGAGTGNITIKAINDDSTSRIMAVVDSSGNRLNVTLNPP
jgi:2-phospho-L-lactate transferase/gluconeogenesis factor (CofD/UPF0052 family)